MKDEIILRQILDAKKEIKDRLPVHIVSRLSQIVTYTGKAFAAANGIKYGSDNVNGLKKELHSIAAHCIQILESLNKSDETIQIQRTETEVLNTRAGGIRQEQLSDKVSQSDESTAGSDGERDLQLPEDSRTEVREQEEGIGFVQCRE